MTLNSISKTLGIEILKIGRVFGPRWAACSYRTVIATWRSYPALYAFFSSDNKFSGMTKRLGNKYFIKDLALMIDILEEMSLLSDALQGRCVNILRAETLIKRTIKVFEYLTGNKGTYERKVDETLSSKEFQHIYFVEDHRYVSLPREKLLNAVIKNMKLRLMNSNNISLSNNIQDKNNKIFELVKLVNPSYWNMEETVIPWKDAEEKLSDFYNVFRHEISVNDFRDYVENVTRNNEKHFIPDTIQKAQNIINTISVSSAEAERGFSVMNTIYSDKRNRLEIKNVANLLVINLIGLPLDRWDCNDSVRQWLRHHNAADNPKGIKNSSEQKYDDNRMSIWKYLSK